MGQPVSDEEWYLLEELAGYHADSRPPHLLQLLENVTCLPESKSLTEYPIKETPTEPRRMSREGEARISLFLAPWAPAAS
jgi:hypothetical protein